MPVSLAPFSRPPPPKSPADEQTVCLGKEPSTHRVTVGSCPASLQRRPHATCGSQHAPWAAPRSRRPDASACGWNGSASPCPTARPPAATLPADADAKCSTPAPAPPHHRPMPPPARTAAARGHRAARRRARGRRGGRPRAPRPRPARPRPRRPGTRRAPRCASARWTWPPRRRPRTAAGRRCRVDDHGLHAVRRLRGALRGPEVAARSAPARAENGVRALPGVSAATFSASAKQLRVRRGVRVRVGAAAARGAGSTPGSGPARELMLCRLRGLGVPGFAASADARCAAGLGRPARAASRSSRPSLLTTETGRSKAARRASGAPVLHLLGVTMLSVSCAYSDDLHNTYSPRLQTPSSTDKAEDTCSPRTTE